LQIIEEGENAHDLQTITERRPDTFEKREKDRGYRLTGMENTPSQPKDYKIDEEEKLRRIERDQRI